MSMGTFLLCGVDFKVFIVENMYNLFLKKKKSHPFVKKYNFVHPSAEIHKRAHCVLINMIIY